MNNFHELLINRRSIRKYTDEPIDADSVKLILEAALMAPTSKSSRSWRFVVVDDPSTLKALSECKPAGAAPIANCKMAVVVCGDSCASDPWIEDASIAAEFMQLQAVDLGLGSCWIQVRGRETATGELSEDFVQELLGIPEEINVLCVMTFGHKAEERRQIDPAKLEWEKVSIGRWSQTDA